MEKTIERKQTLINQYNNIANEILDIDYDFWYILHCVINKYSKDDNLSTKIGLDILKKNVENAKYILQYINKNKGFLLM